MERRERALEESPTLSRRGDHRALASSRCLLRGLQTRGVVGNGRFRSHIDGATERHQVFEFTRTGGAKLMHGVVSIK